MLYNQGGQLYICLYVCLSVCFTAMEECSTSVYLSVQWRIQERGRSCLAFLCEIIGWCTLSVIGTPWKILDLPLLSSVCLLYSHGRQFNVCLSLIVVLHQNKMLPLARQVHICLEDLHFGRLNVLLSLSTTVTHYKHM